VLEDNVLLAESIRILLENNGFEVVAVCAKGEDALDWLAHETTDVAVVDVRLQGSLTGIQTVAELNRTAPVPVVFLTANEDPETIAQILALKPAGYLSKPFKDVDLLTAMRIALQQATHNLPSALDPTDDTRGVVTGKDSLYVRVKKQYERVDFDAILFLQSNRTYTELTLTTRKLVVSAPLGALMDALPPNLFVRIHRSYAVNLKRITAFDRDTVSLGEHVLPLSASHKSAFLSHL
jgi:DNA-binding LytR/AlgR family response regulator